MEIRKANISDAENLIGLFNELDSETEYMLMEPGERNIEIEDQIQLINELENSNSKILLVADKGNQLLGFLGGTAGTAKRERHKMHIAMGVRRAHWGHSIGVKLLQAMLTWAKNNHFHRIELTVMENNQRAKIFYERNGFEIEGLRRDSLKVNGKFTGELYMSKLI